MKYFNPNVLIVAIIATLISNKSHAQLLVSENVPVGFYGRVIDQNNQPVSGASVNLDFIVSYMAENRTESKPIKLKTDDEGKFVLTGITGYGIDKISIQKEGYELSRKTSRSYVFGLNPEHKSNPDSPVIFKMWKTIGKEPLAESSWHGRVQCDGTTNQFDLLTGRPSSSGELEIICKKNPLTVPPPGNAHFDYKFQVALVGGHIQTTTDEFTYLAPETGYTETFDISRKAKDPQWQGGIKQEFYFRTEKGHYGRLYIEWYASQTPPVHLEWNCSINPSGSRNLER